MSSRRDLLRAAILTPAIVRSVRAQDDGRPVLRVAVQGLPPTLEPVESISNVGLRVTDNVFDILLRRDFLAEKRSGRSALVSDVATNLVQRDPLTWAEAPKLRRDSLWRPRDLRQAAQHPVQP